MPTHNFDNPVNFQRKGTVGFVGEVLAAAPSSPSMGLRYFDSVLLVERYWNGTSWINASGGGGSGDVVGPASSVDSQMALFNATTGKLLKASTLTGILKSTSGVTSAAVAGTDYSTPSSTETFTNKTFNANGTGNSVTNLEVADFAAGVINTDSNLSGATGSQLPSALAVSQAIANAVTGVAKPLGGVDCSTNPNYPAASAGGFYRVTVAGRIGGAAGPLVTIGDTLHCFVTSSAGDHATVGTNWVIVQSNVDQATTSTQGLVTLANNAETLAKSDTSKAVTPADLVGFATRFKSAYTVTANTNFTVTHNLNSTAFVLFARRVSTGEVWNVTPTSIAANSFVLNLPEAFAASDFEITVIAG